jgi:hypothetical protein
LAKADDLGRGGDGIKKATQMNNKFPHTAVTYNTVSHIGSHQERSESVSSRIERWYLKPLRAMSGDQGFLVLMVLFPLYEKHLRVVEEMKGDFSQGNRIFDKMGKHLKLPATDAYRFWNNVRNGLLHRALPDTKDSFEYAIREYGPPIEKNGNSFLINPFALRDRLLDVIEPSIKFWKSDVVSLPKTFDPQS